MAGPRPDEPSSSDAAESGFEFPYDTASEAGPGSGTAATDAPDRSRLHYVLMAIGAVVGGIAIGSVLGLVVAIPFVVAGEPADAVLPFVITVEVGYGAVGAAYLAWRGGGLRRYVGWPTPGATVASVLGAVAFVGLGQAVLAPLPGVGLSELTTAAESEAIPPRTLLYLAPVGLFVIGPAEELLFRGAAQELLGKAVSARGAILGATVLFVLVHGFNVVQLGLVGLVPLGIIAVLSVALGWAYERTGTLVVPALVHGVYDAVLFVLAYAVTVGVL